jgi:hypothetical protein
MAHSASVPLACMSGRSTCPGCATVAPLCRDALLGLFLN